MMTTVVLMPRLSATMEEGTVVAWRKSLGDQVSIGDVILEIETDKATLEIEATSAGRLGKPTVNAGEIARVGTPLVSIIVDDEPRESSSNLNPETALEHAVGRTIEDLVDQQATENAEDVSVKKPRLRASPLARRLAAEAGVDLNAVQGTGPSGRILQVDVNRMREASSQIPLGCLSLTTDSESGGLAADPLRMSRRRTAALVVASHREIPAFVLTRWIDMEAVLSCVEKSSNERTETDYLLYGIAAAVSAVPIFRCIWNAETLVAEDLGETNVGLVVSTARGLIIPVLVSLETFGISDISARRRLVVRSAREWRLDQSSVSPSSLSLSNLSRGGADSFEAIISPGQTAIVAVGRIAERLVPRDGIATIRRGCVVSVSADHRVIDGIAGADFLTALSTTLENGNFRE